MTEISKATMTVYRVSLDGRPVAFDIDRELLGAEHRMRADSRRFSITGSDEVVGVVRGEVVDWNAADHDGPRWKVHWLCPQCGLQQWEDWSAAGSRPYLCGSMCACIGYWLVDFENPVG